MPQTFNFSFVAKFFNSFRPNTFSVLSGISFHFSDGVPNQSLFDEFQGIT